MYITFMCVVGEEEISSTIQGSSRWPKNQIDMKQINRRKKKTKFNYIQRRHRHGFQKQGE